MQSLVAAVQTQLPLTAAPIRSVKGQEAAVSRPVQNQVEMKPMKWSGREVYVCVCVCVLWGGGGGVALVLSSLNAAEMTLVLIPSNQVTVHALEIWSCCKQAPMDPHRDNLWYIWVHWHQMSWLGPLQAKGPVSNAQPMQMKAGGKTTQEEIKSSLYRQVTDPSNAQVSTVAGKSTWSAVRAPCRCMPFPKCNEWCSAPKPGLASVSSTLLAWFHLLRLIQHG